MNKKYEELDDFELIKQAFMDVYTIQRDKVKKSFLKYKKLKKQYKVCRSLVFLYDVAKNPDKYFSFEFADKAWNARAEKFMSGSEAGVLLKKYENNPELLEKYYNIAKATHVESPKDFVRNNARFVVKDNEFGKFLDSVQYVLYDYPKNKNSSIDFDKLRDARKDIGFYAGNVSVVANAIRQKNPLKRYVMQFINELRGYRY